MSQVVTIGLDIAKSVFQLHGVDAGGAVLLRKHLPRSRMLAFFEKQAPCLIGIEACGSAHYWGRELSRLGHDVRLIPPSYVKPYVKRQKNDAADAEAICEAVTRPSMRFVPIKAAEQQSIMVAHRTRSIRGHMAEFGLVAPVGRNGLEKLITIINDAADERMPSAARTCLLMLVAQLRLVNQQILESDRCIIASARSTEVGRRLMGIPGVGPVLASALVATIADPKSFSSGRNLAAWIGLVPRQNSSGGKERLGAITKQGDRYPDSTGRRNTVSLSSSSPLRKPQLEFSSQVSCEVARSVPPPPRPAPWEYERLSRSPSESTGAAARGRGRRDPLRAAPRRAQAVAGEVAGQAHAEGRCGSARQ